MYLGLKLLFSDFFGTYSNLERIDIKYPQSAVEKQCLLLKGRCGTLVSVGIFRGYISLVGWFIGVELVIKNFPR
jgi:hypothetical protein